MKKKYNTNKQQKHETKYKMIEKFAKQIKSYKSIKSKHKKTNKKLSLRGKTNGDCGPAVDELILEPAGEGTDMFSEFCEPFVDVVNPVLE
jgi:hypothetical protein